MWKGQRKILSHFLGLTLGLFLIWVLLSGNFEIKFMMAGFLSSLFISYLCLPFLMIHSEVNGKEYFIFDINYLRLFWYGLWLTGQILKGSVLVAKVILTPSMDDNAQIVYFSMPYENPVAAVVLANSIILTPGILTLDMNDSGIYAIHALNAGLAQDVLRGEMPRRVARLFGEDCQFQPLPEVRRMKDCQTTEPQEVTEK